MDRFSFLRITHANPGGGAPSAACGLVSAHSFFQKVVEFAIHRRCMLITATEEVMEFMLIMYEGEPIPEGLMAEMGEFAGKLGAQGKMREGAPLQPAEQAVRIRVEDGSTSVTDGPFAETKEIIAGYFVIDCADRDEAVEHAKACPHARIGKIEVREIIPMGPAHKR